MTESVSRTVNCLGCGAQLSYDHYGPSQPVPCPFCGSMGRNVSAGSVSMVLSSRFRAFVRGKVGRGRKWLRKFKVGDDLYRKTGRWSWLRQEEDRTDPDPANWRYRKKIIDTEMDKVLRDEDKPLLEHRGPGRAKKKS